MGQPPLIHPEVTALLGDRVVSQQMLQDISQLLHRSRNEAFAAGFKEGWNNALDNLSTYSNMLRNSMRPANDKIN